MDVPVEMLLEDLLHSSVSGPLVSLGEYTWPHVDYNLLGAKKKITSARRSGRAIKDVLHTH